MREEQARRLVPARVSEGCGACEPSRPTPQPLTRRARVAQLVVGEGRVQNGDRVRGGTCASQEQGAAQPQVPGAGVVAEQGVVPQEQVGVECVQGTATDRDPQEATAGDVVRGDQVAELCGQRRHMCVKCMPAYVLLSGFLMKAIKPHIHE